jgi:hypothetical protein
MYQSVTVMFCGPHDCDGLVSFRRIDHAIHVALVERTQLLIVGDANHGNDLELFCARAKARNLCSAEALYDSRANTLADAQSVARWVSGLTAAIGTIEFMVVTDNWHMDRVVAMLVGESTRLAPERTFSVISRPVTSGPRPDAQVLSGEEQGIADYYAGTYGCRTDFPIVGKPAVRRLRA